MNELTSKKIPDDYELTPESFIYELYDSGWRYRFDVPFSECCSPAIAKCFVGFCDASRLQVRPRTGEYAVMCEDPDGKFWFHVLPITLDSIFDHIERN